MKSLLSEKTEIIVDKLVANLPQGVLFIAPKGSGKETLLHYIAKQVLGSEYPAAVTELVAPEGESVGIDEIRQVKQLTKLKSSTRIVLVPRTGDLTHEAQNSMLKILEEPTNATHFLIGANHKNELLPTIISRLASYNIVPPTTQQITEYFADTDQAVLKRYIAISNKRMGLLASLVSQEEDSLLNSLELVKEILAEDKFKRLVRVDALVKDKQALELLIEAFVLTFKAALEHAAANQAASAKKWHQNLQFALEAQEQLNQNASPKLVLSKLMVMV
jgi:DNA polymerase-3 subunit delta'